MSEVKPPAAETPVTPPAKEVVVEPVAPVKAADEKPVVPAPAVVPPVEPVKADGDKPVEKPVEPPKAPEKYELKARKDSPLQKSDVEEIEAIAKAQGLSQEHAQKLVESKEADFDKYNQRQQQAYQDQQANWVKEAETDKEIAGPDGKSFKENVELAHRALNKYADDSFKKVLASSGLGNNPHLIRTFYRIGKLMADDKAILDGKSAPPSKGPSREQKLFPTHFSNEQKE